jgi:hypothetical protein
VKKDSSVSLVGNGTTLGKVLDELLMHVSPDRKLTCIVANQKVEITTKAAAEGK